MSPPRAIFIVAGLAAITACAPAPNTLYVTTESYISAVSLNDVERTLAISAPYQTELLEATSLEAAAAVRKRYEDMIEQGYMMWEQAKYSGVLEPDRLGVTLIRAIGLGKDGGAALPMGVSFEAGNTRAIVRARAITNYEGIRWDRIPAGGRMYLLGHPYGKVINFATGFDDPSQFTLLATVDLEWTLVKIPGLERPELAPSDWFVEKLVARADTASSWSLPAQKP
jgi:hypothetical protein